MQLLICTIFLIVVISLIKITIHYISNISNTLNQQIKTTNRYTNKFFIIFLFPNEILFTYLFLLGDKNNDVLSV